MTYRELLQFLKGLEQNNDDRLDDSVTIYNSVDGEYYPSDLLEFNGDDVLDDGHLFIAAYDWNEDFQENEGNDENVLDD